MQGTQYATKRSILCRGAFCGPTMHKHSVGQTLKLQSTVDTLNVR